MNPKGSITPGSNTPDSTLESVNIFKHSAQKSKSSWPSSCFCSSVRRYFDCVISNLPPPWRLTRQTRRFVPPSSYVRWLGRGEITSYQDRQQKTCPLPSLWANRTHMWESWAVILIDFQLPQGAFPDSRFTYHHLIVLRQSQL